MESKNDLTNKDDNNVNKNKNTSTSQIINHNIAKLSSINKPVENTYENKYPTKIKLYNSQVPKEFKGNISTNISNNLNSSSTKMGSRRIFTPQFKLQVLESYRNDNDCKGNQRATARKYNIHRRQIQKWLQCESNLRSSVANINQSSVKHQFHNISNHQNLQQQQQQQQQQHHHQQQQQQQHVQRRSHIPQILTNNYNNFQEQHHYHHLNTHQLSMETRQNDTILPVEISAAHPSTETLSAGNLAAVVTVAAGATTNPSQDNKDKFLFRALVSSSSNTPIATNSPLRPNVVSNNSTTVLPSTLFHQHYPPMSYIHSPANVPVSVPMLTHHISPYYQYHNLSAHTLSHTLTQSQHSSVFKSSLCLPVTVLSTTNTTTTPIKDAAEQTEANYTTKMSSAIATGNSSQHGAVSVNKSSENVTPMDLSLGYRQNKEEDNKTPHDSSRTTLNSLVTSSDVNDSSVVDLTFRKRKVITPNMNVDNPSEKVAKISESTICKSQCDVTVSQSDDVNVKDENNEDEIEVEADPPPSKPIKLFKPYLLDETDNENKTCNEKPIVNCCEHSSNEQREPIIWSNHPAFLSPHSYDVQHDGNYSNNFQTSFPIESPNFSITKSISPKGILSPTSAPAMSPPIFCFSKGSPVSGYESSSSTYSDSSCRSEFFNNGICNFDFQMHSIYSDPINQQHKIQKWLDQDPRTSKASITLFV